LIAFGSSLDQIGPITTNFSDCAYLMNIICGPDDRDSTCAVTRAPDFTKSLVDDVKGLKIGLPRQYFAQGLSEEVKASVMEAIGVLEKKGAKVIEIDLPNSKYAVAVYYIVASSEASSNLQRFDGVRYGLREPAGDLKNLYNLSRAKGFGNESKRRIFLGTYSLSSGYYDAYYVRALKVRRLIKQDFDKAFKDVDLIAAPTSPTAAFKIGEKSSDPLSMYLSDIYTISANLAGVPAVSLPCGFSNGLPLGLQLIAKEFDEQTLIRAGYSYQCGTEWHKRIPNI
jgi:aspartyl-tRNA(Asn)/glutamyl-tRNA(Gln) amidotransferase subunit A